MAAPVIQFKRGVLANLPGLRAGEPGFTTDSYDLYVGIDSTTSNNQFVGSGRYWTVNTATTGSGVNLVEATNEGTSYITLKSPDILSGITTYTFPASPTDGYYLKTDANGVLAWGEVVTNNITTSNISAATLVTESEGIGSNDNDTTLPTSAAVKDYTDTVAAANETHIDNLATLSGVAKDSTDLGTFSGTTISDSRTVKQALQDLETSLETVSGGGSGATSVAVARTDANSTHYLTFVDANNATKTQEDIQTDAGITYNPSTNLLTLSNLSMAGVAVTAILDEDTLVSDRADALATQQSIKAYVDTQITAQDLDISDGVHTGAVDLDSQTLTFSGTAGEVTTAVNSQTVTIGLPSAVVVTTSIDVPTVEVTNVKAKDGTAAITITDSTGAVATTQNLTVGGNLIVNGSTTQVNTSQTTIEDQLLELGMVDGSAPTSDLNKDIGVIFNYYTDAAKKAAVYWDDSASRIVVSAVATESSGVMTNSTAGALEIGSLYVNDCAGNTQVINCSGSERTLENITLDGGSF